MDFWARGILAMVSNANTDVDKLITFGQMALEQGWYDQARECFEQVLVLDASNVEAAAALVRIDEMLYRKPSVEPVTMQEVEARREQSRGVRYWAIRVVLVAVVLGAVIGIGLVTIWEPVVPPTGGSGQTSNSFAQRSTDILRQYLNAGQTCDVARMRDLRWQWASLTPPARARVVHRCTVECMDCGISACSMLQSFQVEQFLGAADEFERCADCWRRCDAIMESLK